MISREKDFQAKQEGDTNDGKYSKVPSSSSRQWSGFRNPRIVRVSRSFGGKDRHSKVCTIRGLRDRRIRLSVPTAIQLYDLQDRLGLSQPSKVVDWLLDVTKNDIDKLPPLQMPEGFGQFHQQILFPHESSTSQSAHHLPPFFDANSTFLKDGGFHHSLLSNRPEGIKINNSTSVDAEDQTIMAKTKYYWDMDSSLRAKSKEVERQSTIAEKGKWIKTNDHQQENHDGISTDYSGEASAQKFFPIASTHSSVPGLLNNALPFNPYYHWDPPNLSLSQFGSHGFLSPTDHQHSLNVTNSAALPSSLALPSGSTQLFFCPPPATMPSLFPTYPAYGTSTPTESDASRQINHFHLFGSSNSQNILPNSLTNASSSMKTFSLKVSSDENDHSERITPLFKDPHG